MNIGKLFAILGGSITLLGMFLFVLFGQDDNLSYVIGAYITFNSVIVNVSTHATNLGVGEWVIYLGLVGYVIFSVTGFIQLGGAKSKLAAIIGSVIPLLVGILLIGIPGFRSLMSIFTGPSLFNIEDLSIIPIVSSIGGFGIGFYLLFIGSILTFISVFLNKSTKNN
jgi:hypothetical protein